MENIIPLDRIPDKWLEKSRCPVCSTNPLKIDHREGEPDRFLCPNCYFCFQVATSQPSVFVIQDPVDVRTGFAGKWVEMKTLVEQSRRQKQSVVDPSTLPKSEVQNVKSAEEKFTDLIYGKFSASLVDSAVELYEMGNSLSSIRNTLSRNSQLSDDEIGEIIGYISRHKRKKEKASFKPPRWAIGCIMVPLILFLLYLGVSAYLRYSFYKELAAAPGAIEITVIDFEKLPEGIQNEIPEEVRTMQWPKATITRFPSTNLPQTACPETVQTVVSLYGGKSGDWEEQGGNHTWVMTSDYPRVINVPEGFVAAVPYMKHGLNMQVVLGPARVQNAYVVSIACP
jgi:hypothetical protein